MATRAYLRKHIGRVVGDVDVCTATASGSNSTTVLVDALNLAEENNSWVGRLGWFASGTSANLSSTVRVTGNTKSTTLVTFTPALPSAVATGDVIEFYNRNDAGPTILDIHDAINRVIESVSKAALTEVVGSPAVYDGDSPTIAIPATWRRLIGVEWQDDDDQWHEVDPADLHVDRVDRTVRIDHITRWNADTQSVRLRGYTPATAALTTDSDATTGTTTVDAEFIIHEAASQLLLANAEKYRDPAAARATAQYHRGLADSRRPKVLAPILGRGWVLPT
jgi:hypothetical protein